MRHRRIFFTIVFLMTALQGSRPATTSSQPTEDLDAKLNRQITNYALGTNNFVEALTLVGKDFQIPMGIAFIDTPAATREIAFERKAGTVRNLIDEIVERETDYKVEIKNGVVHVFSPGAVAARENFLNLRLKEFRVHNAYPEVALFKLHELISPTNYGGYSIGAESGQPRVSLELKDSTVGDILDVLAVTSSRHIWVVAFSADPTLTPRGYRRTLALWPHPSPAAESSEPVLNLLHWSDRIPWAEAAQ
jgi:hypothetical protein